MPESLFLNVLHPRNTASRRISAEGMGLKEPQNSLFQEITLSARKSGYVSILGLPSPDMRGPVRDHHNG
jgi:hypothetical protein